MPTYEYACADCGHEFETRQSIHDKPMKSCPECGGKLRKLFGNVGLVFKGAGFYKTDSRAEAKRGKARGGHEGKKSDSGAGESGGGDSGTAKESKPGSKESKPDGAGSGSKDASGSKAASRK